MCMGLLAAFAARGHVESAKFEVGAIRPSGHLLEFLKRQVSGTTGRHSEIGYPFDGCMWAGVITNVYFEEDLPYSRKFKVPTDGKSWSSCWWPYEQSAYLLDGMIRLSQLVGGGESR